MIGSTGAKTGVLALILALMPTILSAAVVRISWNANTESDLEGYRVFYGTSHGSYGSVINVGRRTTIDVSGLAAGMTYYFAVTAYDFNGNESAFSEERFVSIPSQSSPEGSDPDDDGGLIEDIGNVVEWLEQVVRNIFGLDPDVPVYALGDFGAVDVTGMAVPTSTMISNTLSGHDEPFYTALCDVYPVKDAILETMFPLDLSVFYPDGDYLFYPLNEACPEINEAEIVAENPGMYLYVVFDETGKLDHLLRLSVVEEIYQLSSYNPSHNPTLGMIIEDAASGIAVDLPGHATEGITPVAIGWGGFEAFPGSALLAPDRSSSFFDILPYGLELRFPAVVSLPVSGDQATAEWYDDEKGCWVTMDDVQVAEGYMSFSAQALGRFKVTNLPGAVTEDAPYEGREGTCFVSVARM